MLLVHKTPLRFPAAARAHTAVADHQAENSTLRSAAYQRHPLQRDIIPCPTRPVVTPVHLPRSHIAAPWSPA
jgi:hypothetical protein